MKKLSTFSLTILLAISIAFTQNPRSVEDFNFNWKFNLGDEPSANEFSFNDENWRELNLPHDWSIEQGYQQENTAASTGFVPGGIGWYRKTFKIPASDKGKHIRIVFDGVYNNSSVWINGHFLGHRPYGYSSFTYDLSDYINYGEANIIAVKVDRSAYADSRWYTGSGIYRKVQLITTSPIHLAQWGIQISTPEISKGKAQINVQTALENSAGSTLDNLELQYSIIDKNGAIVASHNSVAELKNESNIELSNPNLWSTETPNLYSLKVELFKQGELLDESTETFGIRSFYFDANTGFWLNGINMKIKGVNLHHDAGALGAAVPKAIWEDRLQRLKSIGVNAIRLSHNPHSIELLEACNEMGFLVMNEAFDEWDRPKGKNLVYIGDNAATGDMAKAYPEVFNEWAERDLKDLIKRDYNHPSIIMWSIGNEIEWIYPYYSEVFNEVNGEGMAYKSVANYDSLTIKKEFDKATGGTDTLMIIAKMLYNWVKEMDTTRPVILGSVRPSIGLASGFTEAIDILGFNYGSHEYDAVHAAYPDLKILGSENWVAYSEWKYCAERDFVPGIFVWTGFAYLGEAGPWPRKGLNISLFDFAGNKNPRGHFFECLWNDTPKTYLVTTPASESEYSYTEEDGWKFDMQYTAPPVWNMLRMWEWYKVYSKWKYSDQEPIIVQSYTNCEEAELFLNGKSLGRKKRSDFEDDNIIKWLVPYSNGELKVTGYNNGVPASTYSLKTHMELADIEINSTKDKLSANGYDVTVIELDLLDKNKTLLADAAVEITFNVEGSANIIGIDNGWEYNTQNHKSNSIITHNGKAFLFIQSTQDKGKIKVTATSGKLKSNQLIINSK